MKKSMQGFFDAMHAERVEEDVKNSKTLFQCIIPKEAVKREQIESAEPYQTIDNSGKPGHISEQPGDKVEIKKSNQPPVYGSDNYSG